MSRWVFDIETDDLLKNCTKMWLLCAYNLDEKKMYYFLENDPGWKGLFSKAKLVVGHNILGFDNSALTKLFGFKFPKNCNVHDTMILSQILDYKRFGNKGHSLAEWGEFLGYPKIEFSDFSKYTPEMLTYGLRDVELTVKVYEFLMKEYVEAVSSSKQLQTYIQAEHAVAKWSAEASLKGWPFNLEKALELQEKLSTEMQNTTKILEERLGMKTIAVDKKKGIVETKFPKWTKQGFYDAHTSRWFNIDPCCGFEGEERPIVGEYCRIEFEHLKLSSSDDVKIFLFRNGWVPTEWNSTRDEFGAKKVTSPKITEDSLELLGGDGKLYTAYLTARSRYGILKTWIDNTDSEGMLHGDCMTIGTPSMRSRHSIIVNVPSVDSVWGPEMRELFGCKPGWSFIGADSAGNQARGLAHYLGDPTFIDTLLNGDIHQYNADVLTGVLKEMKVDYTVKRSQAKRILYAFLFGASGSKLWSYIFGNLDDKQGKKLKNGFLKAVPGFKTLLEKLERIYGKTSQNGFGYIPSLAGNRIYVDSFHKLLVYLLQSAEKITCSAALMLTVKKLEEENIPYQPLIMYHDELDFMTPDEYAERAAQIAAEAFREGPKLFNVMIMDGESKIGRNWRECH